MIEKLRAVWRDAGFRETLFVFGLSRFIVLTIFIVAGAAELDRTAPTFNSDDPHPRVWVRPAEMMKQLERILGRGDSGWNVDIAEHGYEAVPFEATRPHNWAFFPLYPLLLSLGGKALGSYFLWGALLSNAAFFFALLLLHKLVIAFGYERAIADRTIFFTAVSPVSYFFSLPIPESLFLLLNVGSFLAAIRGRWWAAGLLGGCASATRQIGIVLLPALALLYAQRTSSERRWRGGVIWLALMPVGLLAFMLVLWNATGDALAFAHVQGVWKRQTGFFLWTLYDYLRSPFQLIEPWNFRALNFAFALTALGAGIYWIRRKQWAFASFTLLAILPSLSSLTLQSAGRHVLVIFPVFIALAIAGQRPRVDQCLRALFLILFALMTLCYALRFSFASA